MKTIKIQIPSGLKFSDLNLSRHPGEDRDLEFDTAPFIKIAELNPHIDIENEEVINAIMIAWYKQHLSEGGATDPVIETLLSEIAIEDSFGFAIETSGKIQ